MQTHTKLIHQRNVAFSIIIIHLSLSPSAQRKLRSTWFEYKFATMMTMTTTLNRIPEAKSLTKSAMLATWIASCTTSARVLPFRLSNIDLSTTMAVSIYLVASRTSRRYRPAPFACSISMPTPSLTMPDMCFWRRDIRQSKLPEFAQPLFALVRASNITCGCFWKETKEWGRINQLQSQSKFNWIWWEMMTFCSINPG